MKKQLMNVKKSGRLVYASLSALAISLLVPGMGLAADPIADAVKDFDTTNIMLAGAAVIGLVIAFVGVRKVIQMIKAA